MNDQYYWTISGLKNIGGMNSKRNYWKCVLAALLITLSTGSAGSGSSSIVNSLSENENYSGIFSHGAEMFSWSTVGLGAIAAIFFGASIVALIVGIFLLYPLEVGARRFFITNRVSNAQIDQVGIAFSSNYLNIVKTQFLRYLFTYLWSLLFLVPGIIKSYEYRMIPYILAENPSINWREAFRLSKAMMDGQKWNAFVLDLSFIGWHILSAFTFGLLDLFYTNPYQQQTNAELYDVLKSRLFGTQRQNYGGNGYGPNGGYNGGNGYETAMARTAATTAETAMARTAVTTAETATARTAVTTAETATVRTAAIMLIGARARMMPRIIPDIPKDNRPDIIRTHREGQRVPMDSRRAIDRMTELQRDRIISNK